MAAKKSTNTKSKNTTKKRTNTVQQPEPHPSVTPLFVHGIVWAAMFVFTMLFIYMDSDAIIARAVKEACGGMFGTAAYFIPAVFAGTLIYLAYTKSVWRMWVKFFLCLFELSDAAALIGLFSMRSYGMSAAYRICSQTLTGGGVVGIGLASSFSGLITSVGAFLVFLILFVVFGCFIAHVNVCPYLLRGIKRFLGFSGNTAAKVRAGASDYAAKRREHRQMYDEYTDDDYDEDYKEMPEKKSKRYEIPESGDELPVSLKERRRKKSEAAEPEQQSARVKRTCGTRTIDIANDFASDFENDNFTGISDNMADEFKARESKFDLYNMKFDTGEYTEPATETEKPKRTANKPAASDNKQEEKLVFDDDIFNTYDSGGMNQESDAVIDEVPGMTVDGETTTRRTSAVRMKNLSETEKVDFSKELTEAMQSEERIEYVFPSLDLLDKAKYVSNDKRQELYKKAEQLISILDNFGVKAKPVQVTQGPTVTRYEIQPSSGTKLSKIVGLADDIALNLAVSTVLIAPVPGKAATVGVEIPNSNVTPVKIREMLESPEFRNAKSKLTVCLGKDIGGNVVVGDIAKWPHALIAGATGSGKSVCINTIVTSILYKASPDEVKLIMIDPKQVELGVYNGIPHLLIPVVTEAKKAAGALNWAVQEMMRRYDLFKETGVRKLEGYNKLMEQTGGEKVPQLVIIIDELADLMMVAAKEVEDYICRLAQLARAAGIHLIIATQRPSVDVITGLIKANVPSRIAFFVSSQVDSRTILDKAGAEKLLGMGDMLYFPTGARSTRRVQGAFVSDGEVERIIDFIKETSPETHYREDLAEHIERIQLGENGVTPDKEDDGDALLNDAIKLAVELGKISTSMVQRRLSVGYSRAGRIIDQMEARGIISPANGAKPRDVLISHADLDAFNDNISEESDYDEE